MIWHSIAILITLALLLGGCTVAKKADPKADDATAQADKPAGQTDSNAQTQTDPHSGEPAAAAEIPAVPSPIKDQDGLTQHLIDVARTAMGNDKAQILVGGEVVSAILDVDAGGASDKNAYLTKMLTVARTVTNEAMKTDGVGRIRVIVQSDGTFGTPKNSLAVSLTFEKAKMAPAQWGHLASADDLLAAAATKTVEKALQ
jgi:hypothetical protein